jgi:hypothetical protein
VKVDYIKVNRSKPTSFQLPRRFIKAALPKQTMRQMLTIPVAKPAQPILYEYTIQYENFSVPYGPYEMDPVERVEGDGFYLVVFKNEEILHGTAEEVKRQMGEFGEVDQIYVHAHS